MVSLVNALFLGAYLYLSLSLPVQVYCTRDEMSIRYRPKDWFQGKMYASMHSNDCQVSGAGNDSLLLHLEIGSEAKENRCGVLRAYEMTQAYQR